QNLLGLLAVIPGNQYPGQGDLVLLPVQGVGGRLFKCWLQAVHGLVSLACGQVTARKQGSSSGRIKQDVIPAFSANGNGIFQGIDGSIQLAFTERQVAPNKLDDH